MLLEKYIRDALLLWTTIDPIGTLSLFAALTAGLTPEIRKRTALKATLYATAILVGSMVIGQILLSGLGVQLVSLQIAGVIILFLFGLQMIFGTAGQPAAQSESGHDLAVFPLAVPSIASPGAIMAIIVLTDNHMYSVSTQMGTTIILLGILGVTYVFMLAATPILRVIGINGAAILVRVMGMILAALSVELVFGALGLEKWKAAGQGLF